MRRRLLVFALILSAASATSAAQIRKVNVTETTTRHKYDPAKLKITEIKLAEKDAFTGEAKP